MQILAVHISYRLALCSLEFFKLNLLPTVSRPVCLGVGLPAGVQDQILVFCLTVASFLKWGALSDERTCM
jgi:hypothetical protein